MKGFLKFIAITAASFAVIVGALAIFDRYVNKNRIKGAYLNCESGEEPEE